MQKLSDKEYKYIYSRVPRICIDLIIKTRKGLLLTKRDIPPEKNKWHLPGGMVYKGEKLTDVVKRIALNELGILPIEFKLFNYVGEYLNELNKNKIRVHSVAVDFRIYKWKVIDENKFYDNVGFFKKLEDSKINKYQLKQIRELIGL
jgi:ADP-ribose pyrophosphatase YjhB (NUDIX family)